MDNTDYLGDLIAQDNWNDLIGADNSDNCQQNSDDDLVEVCQRCGGYFHMRDSVQLCWKCKKL